MSPAPPEQLSSPASPYSGMGTVLHQAPSLFLHQLQPYSEARACCHVSQWVLQHHLCTPLLKPVLTSGLHRKAQH